MEGRPGDALERFKLVAQRYPRDRFTLNQMGECYQLLGNHAEARKIFEQVIVIDPDDITALYFVLDSYRNTGAIEIAARANAIYLDKFEDWRNDYLANEKINVEDMTRD